MYLTPDAPASDVTCRRFSIPDNFLALFMGALYELAIDYRWEQFGALTPEESAEAFRVIIDGYSEGCMVGTIWEGFNDTYPDGVLPLDGSTYNDSDYPLLAAAVSAWSNGDGTFTVPNTARRVLVGADPDNPTDPYIVGDTFGVEQVTLTEAQIPAHAHWYDKTIPAESIVLGELPGIQLGAYSPTPTANAGGGEAHENRPPSTVVKRGVWYK